MVTHFALEINLPVHYFYSHEYLIQKFNSAISQAPTELEPKLQHTRDELFTLSFPSYEVDAKEYFSHWLQQQNIPGQIIAKIQTDFLIDYIKHQQSLAVLSHGEIFTENLDKTFDELKKISSAYTNPACYAENICAVIAKTLFLIKLSP